MNAGSEDGKKEPSCVQEIRNKEIARSSQALGKKGEDAAAEYLSKNGFRIVARNWRCGFADVPLGKQKPHAGNAGMHGLELDIVAEKKGLLVFVEVKSRRQEAAERLTDNFTAKKQQNLCKAAALYLSETGKWDKECRFDLICVRVSEDGRAKLEHYQNVIEFRNTMDSSYSTWQPW